MKSLRYLILVIFLAFIPLRGFSYDPLPAGVSIYTLDNGLQVLMIEKPSLPMVGVNVVVKVGSAYEDFVSSGMSHMLEHLLFNGTTEMTQKELYDAVDLIGGYNNANTGEYYTNFMMVTPSDQILEGMKIQAGMLFDSLLPEKKFEKEKGIVMEEIAKSLASSREQKERLIRSLLYRGHALSLPVLGTYETIRHMNRDQVHAFYKNHYVPNNMILSMIGNFKTKEMLAQIKSIYGIYSPGKVQVSYSETWKTGFWKPGRSDAGMNRTYHRFYSGKDMQLQLFFELPGDLTSEAFSLLGVFLEAQTDPLQELLEKEIPEVFRSISMNTRISPIGNYLVVDLTLANDSPVEICQKILKRELAAMTFAMAPQSIENEAVVMQSSFFRNTEKPHMFGIYNASDLAVSGIESILSAYSGKGYQESADKLKDISFSRYLFSLMLHPQIEKVEGEDAPTTSIVHLPDFEGGASIIVKQIPGSELVALHYLIGGKSFYEDKYGDKASHTLHDCFGQRMKSEDVQSEIKMYGLKFTVNDNPWIPMDNIYLHPDFGYIRIEGLAKYTIEIIQFINQSILSFEPTLEEFDQAISKQKRMSMMKSPNPGKERFEEAYRTQIYVQEPEKEEVELTFENLQLFEKAYFQPDNMILSVVSNHGAGDLSAEFASFSSTERAETSLPQPRSTEFIIPEKSEPVKIDLEVEQALIFYGYVLSVEESDIPALRALSLLLRDEIIFDIREKQGLAYRMGAGITIAKDKALFYINMGTRPENIETIEPQLPGFFTNEITAEWTEKDLQKAVNMYLGRMMFRRLSSINQGFYLGKSLYFEGDLNYDKKQLDALKAVTFDDVKRVSEAYLKVENPVSVIVY